MSTEIENLLRIMPAEFGLDECVAWARVNRVWGTAFPSDYVEFMAVYGRGSINNSVHILRAPTVDQAEFERQAEETSRNVAELNEYLDSDYAGYPTPGGLILWGTDYCGSDAYWKTGAANPDEWPVILYDRGENEWVEYPPGMADLLVAQITRGIDDRPFSMMDRIEGRPPRFINSRVEETINTSAESWSDLAD